MGIKARGQGTSPFSAFGTSCEMCCADRQAPCSNCTSCLNDKTGPCEYCWKPLPGHNTGLYDPKRTCLGHEAADGTAPKWHPGDAMIPGWSPGCARCWSDESFCKPFARPVRDAA